MAGRFSPGVCRLATARAPPWTHHAIHTTSQAAQREFDRGLTLVYAFDYDRAIQAFERAAQLEPKASMPHWGIALALGPNINGAVAHLCAHR